VGHEGCLLVTFDGEKIYRDLYAEAIATHLQIGISLPAGSETVANGVFPCGTIQNLTTAITWTFGETARAGTTTNS
jgi:hypothetical protein